MNEARVTQLGYLGLEVSDADAWRSYATGVLGLAADESPAERTTFLRMDDRHHRIALHPGPKDDVAYVGWEVRDASALDAVVARLEARGCSVERCGDVEASARRVMGLARTADPSGVHVELYWGALIEGERPFRPTRPLGGFEAGDLGAGHIVLAVDEYEASLAFYRDGLGLRISDYIELAMGGGAPTRVAFLHCGPRHHSIAFAAFPAERRLHHFMLQVRDLDDVGRTYDLCLERGVPIASTLGRHTNDHMTSFYMRTPSGFQVEYGWGGVLVDDAEWEIALHRSPSLWGHRSVGA